MTNEKNNHPARYDELIDDSVVPEDVIEEDTESEYACPRARARFGYHTEKDMRLLMHAFAQIPLAVASAKTKRDLGKPTLTYDGRGLAFTSYAAPGDDRLVPKYASGNYRIMFDGDTRKWSVFLIWSEAISASRDIIQSLACDIDTLDDVIRLMRNARSLGVRSWLEERSAIEEQRRHETERIAAKTKALMDQI